MERTPPLIHSKSADELVEQIEQRLIETGWRPGPPLGVPRPGAALVRLFGRLADIVIARLNQIPEKQFRAFLTEAGVDLLPPRPARAEVSFVPAKDAPEAVAVPAGTQVAAKRTESRPEIVFETERDLTVSRAVPIACIAADPVSAGDRTALALDGVPGSFAAFRGDEERERVLFLDDEELFTFADDASRTGATLTLSFELATPGQPDLDGWTPVWQYFDGSSWRDLVADAKASVIDGTAGFSRDGEVRISGLPPLVRHEFPDGSGAWLACRLTGGTQRRHLPTLLAITGARRITIPLVPAAAADAIVSAIHGGSAFVPVKPADDFYPFGQNPGRLDACYIRADEAFAKAGATVELSFDLAGLGAGEGGAAVNGLRLEWAYAGAGGWTRLGSSTSAGVEKGAVLDFTETSGALTRTGTGLTASFHVPRQGGTPEAPPFAPVTIGDQEGLWLRLRMEAGGYRLDPAAGTTCGAPELRPPLLKSLRVIYRNYEAAGGAPRPLGGCASRVDDALRHHGALDGTGQPVAPFGSDCDEPALYLGFAAPFPAGRWVQLLFDADEERNAGDELPPVLWEYWCGAGRGWRSLPVSDETGGLRLRGYLGFYGPGDQAPRTAFGHDGWWLRARPHREPPVAETPASATIPAGEDGEAQVLLDAGASRAFNGFAVAKYRWVLHPFAAEAGDPRQVTTTGDEATVTLDASADHTGRTLTRYRWRLVSSSHLAAHAGADRVVTVSGDEATLTLDASASADLRGDAVHRYRWRLLAADETGEAPALPPPTPYLKGIYANTVPAVNATTMREEILGSSSGKGGQRFRLQRAPVLPDLVLYVRETDLPPADELARQEAELLSDGEEESLAGFPVTKPSGRGVWVRWRRMDDFFSSGPASRHYVLDQIAGEVRFGDGRRGRIPPLGRDVVLAARYRTHQGADGNVDAGEIAVIRSPTGQLATLKRVVNPEGGAGGSAVETVAEVRERGPATLKHRGAAITLEDYAWLARDASGEVVRAWCLPTRDPDGLTREGWVTVVILPEVTDARPVPRPALVRHVRDYVAERALVNLSASRRLIVKGPEYVEVSVAARLVPKRPEQSDAVKLAVAERLRSFLAPVAGGPQRQGWELGRDVFLSEVYAEVEAVGQVDFAATATLCGSIQQLNLSLGRAVAVPVPEGSRIGTFDERIRMVLAGEVPGGPETTAQITVYGFKAGDRVHLVDADNRVVRKGLAITSLGAGGSEILFDHPFAEAGDLPPPADLALQSADLRIRLPLASWLRAGEMLAGVRVEWFRANADTICIVAGVLRSEELEFIPLTEVALRADRIVVPPGHLACPGTISVETILAE